MTKSYDFIVIGAGPVGENVADYAIRDSDRTCALIEAELVGGECSYYACMPSKALLHPIEIAETAAQLGGLARIDVDVPALLARRDVWRSQLDDSGQVAWAHSAGIDLIRGRGRLTGERRVSVTDQSGTPELLARHAVVVATGSVPVVPPLYASSRPWTSRDATGVVEIPDTLAIIGGGIVACEAATWMNALGAKVTMFVRGKLLSHFEPFAGKIVTERLRAAGIDIRLGAQVSQAHRPGPTKDVLGQLHGGQVDLVCDGEQLRFDELLVASGRRPALDSVGLEAVGLSAAAVSDPNPALPSWLKVIGDAAGVATTHWGKYQARMVGEELAAIATGRPAPAPAPEFVPVPQVVFTDPPVAATGLTSAEATERGIRVRTIDQPITAAAGAALLRDDAGGQARLVIDQDAGTLVGATFVGPGVSELVHSATIAIVGKVPLAVLRHAVPSYPTVSEIWLRLLESRT